MMIGFSVAPDEVAVALPAFAFVLAYQTVAALVVFTIQLGALFAFAPPDTFTSWRPSKHRRRMPII
jgi:hypothetical protein